MENKEVVKAIHDLELSVSERIHKHTTALELNNQRLHDLTDKVNQQHISLFGSYGAGEPGLLQRMDQLEKAEAERKWTVRTVSASFLGLAVKFVWDMFHGSV